MPLVFIGLLIFLNHYCPNILALRPNPTSFFGLIQKTEAKKIKAAF